VEDRAGARAAAALSGDGYWNVPIEVQCPYCGERVEIAIEPDVWGNLVQDCEVCCNPWQLTITRDRDGDPDVKVERLE
jgi:hypothetical protein